MIKKFLKWWFRSECGDEDEYNNEVDGEIKAKGFNQKPYCK